jgi:hypothetical protein
LAGPKHHQGQPTAQTNLPGGVCLTAARPEHRHSAAPGLPTPYEFDRRRRTVLRGPLHSLLPAPSRAVVLQPGHFLPPPRRSVSAEHAGARLTLALRSTSSSLDFCHLGLLRCIFAGAYCNRPSLASSWTVAPAFTSFSRATRDNNTHPAPRVFLDPCLPATPPWSRFVD